MLYLNYCSTIRTFKRHILLPHTGNANQEIDVPSAIKPLVLKYSLISTENYVEIIVKVVLLRELKTAQFYWDNYKLSCKYA